MRVLDVKEIIPTIRQLCIDANYHPEGSLMTMLKKAKNNEDSNLGKSILSQIIENDEIATRDFVPMCQDTGIVVVFAEIGTGLALTGNLEEAINEGVRQGYEDGYLRKSVVGHPLDRVNTKDNTPAIIHFKVVSGDELKITLAPKGAGSENMSALRMLKPSDGYLGVKAAVIDAVKEAGGNACPPIIVGVGVGGNFEKSALIAKEALMRPLEDQSVDPIAARLEAELLEELNQLNIGPMGFGGKTTALAVKVETYPCHIASLPVAINIQCHASRHLSHTF